jgi:hypothetical protein
VRDNVANNPRKGSTIQRENQPAAFEFFSAPALQLEWSISQSTSSELFNSSANYSSFSTVIFSSIAEPSTRLPLNVPIGAIYTFSITPLSIVLSKIFSIYYICILELVKY